MRERHYRTGDLVRFQLSTRSVQGRIREDRGPIGVNGRRLFLVEFRQGPQSDSLSLIELPAEQLESVENTAATE